MDLFKIVVLARDVAHVLGGLYAMSFPTRLDKE